MIAAPAAAKLRTEVGTLNLVERLNLTPGLIADSARDVDFQFQERHINAGEPTPNFVPAEIVRLA